MKLGLIIGIISLVIGIIALFYTVIIPWASGKLAPIKVKPSTISLKELPWQIKTTFWVRNKTGETLFDIWIKVSIYDCDIKSNDILIDAGDGSMLESTLSSISIDYDYVRIDGIDAKGRQSIFFIIHHLGSQVSQPFIAKVESKTEIKEGTNPRILMKVVHHSNEPVKLLRQNNEIAYPFTPPENFTVKSVSLKMRRK